MRSFTPLVAWATALSVALLVALQVAHAGSAEAPELTDGAGDCAVPYGNLYLDVVAAWIDTETADTFDVHLQLASWEEEVAEGSGFTVQFAHQGVVWGVVAVYSDLLVGGWEFSTGQASAEIAQGIEDAPGSFDAEKREIVVTFAKSLFPHTDASDTTLRDFVALSADLRPAYPFFAGEEAGLDPNGRWIVCDDAVGTGTYAFGSGTHSAHAASAEAVPEESAPTAQVDSSETNDTELTPQSTQNDTPLPLAVALGGLALAALAQARRR